MLAGPPRLLSVLIVVFLLCAVAFYFHLTNTLPSLSPTPISNNPPSEARPTGNLVNIPQEGYPSLKPPGSNYSHVLVIPKTQREDIQWLHDELPDMPLAVYEVDKPDAPLTVPKNKGREATVYLTYIIDHYDDLPDIVLFFHAHRYAWHNNILLNQDTALTLKRLNLERVARMGYMNSRCEHRPGCPDWIHMDRPVVDWDFIVKPEEPHFTKAIWREVFPGIPPPPALAAQCCAQFMVTRERIRGVPKERYEFIRKWLLDTKLEDQLSGRVLEYTWHYIFTGYFEYCPAAHSCFCDGYGVCFGNETSLKAWEEDFQKRTDAFHEFERLKKQEGEAAPGEERDRIAGRKEELQGVIARLDVDLNRGKMEAYARGENPQAREMERERLE